MLSPGICTDSGAAACRGVGVGLANVVVVVEIVVVISSVVLVPMVLVPMVLMPTVLVPVKRTIS